MIRSSTMDGVVVYEIIRDDRKRVNVYPLEEAVSASAEMETAQS